MAELARSADKFEHYVAYIENRLAELEENEREWSSLSPEDRSDFLLDWPIVEDKMRALALLVEQEGVPVRERERYEDLMVRIRQSRATIDALWRRGEGVA
jgi:hypothetical protein